VDRSEILGCVQKGVDYFGINMMNATYDALEMNDNLSPPEIFEFPEAFVQALETVFGPAHVLAQRSIIREMQKGLDEMTGPASSYSISDAFEIALRHIDRNP